MRLKIAAAPTPRSHDSMYCMPTLMFWRRPASVIVAAGLVEGDEVRALHVDLGALAVDLILALTQDGVEVLHGDRDEVRVRHPGAVEAVVGLAQLVFLDPRHRHGVDVGVAAAGDERRHAAHGVGAALVAGLDQQLRIGAHERHRHRDLAAVGHDQRSSSALNFLLTLKM